MQIWANTIVNNEENFVWFSVMSVVDYVDKVMIFDTGSTDQTVNIIKEITKIRGEKIIFKEVGAVSKEKFPKIRQQMLEESNCDWIIVLDGDEIWWDQSIKEVVLKINKEGDKIEGIVVPMIVPVGDIYHYQDQKAGRYEILGRKGHFSLKAFSKKIPGLHVDWPYGKESFLDKDNCPIQEREGTIFLDAPLLHVTHLKRSAKLRKFDKFKYELGRPFSKNFKFPEVFYLKYPSFISSPWSKLRGFEKITSYILTPLRQIKRRIV